MEDPIWILLISCIVEEIDLWEDGENWKAFIQTNQKKERRHKLSIAGNYERGDTTTDSKDV